MYLLTKTATRFDDPWPVGVIEDCLPTEVADHLAERFYDVSEDLPYAYKPYKGKVAMQPLLHTSIFKDFFEINWECRKKLSRDVHEFFDLPYDSKCDMDHINWVSYFPDRSEPVRPWHIDNFDKKFQFLLYLGKSDPEPSFEMNDSKEGEPKRTFDFKHNRLIFFYNNTEGNCWHRYWSKRDDNRLTVNFNIRYENELKYRGIPDKYIR